VYAFARTGVRPLRAAHRALVDLHGIDAVVLVDGGTDILMRGDEAELGTPEEDMASVAALAALDDVAVRLVVSVGFGVDAYHGVNHVQVLESIAAPERDGGYLGAFSISRATREGALYLDAVEYARQHTPEYPSIVNRSIAAAVRGEFGDVRFTEPTRGTELFVNPLMSLCFVFELPAPAARCLYLDRVEETHLRRRIHSRVAEFRDTVVTRPPRRFPHRHRLPKSFRLLHNGRRHHGRRPRWASSSRRTPSAAADRTGGTRMARAGVTPERLARAGAELADEVGFDRVTVSELARRFGVKVASLYSHVRSSDDLKTRIALLALEEMADRVADALAGRAGKDALAAFADAYRGYAREHPGRYAAARHRLDPQTAAASAGVRHARMMRAVLRGYDLPEPDRTHAVRMLGGVLHGYVELELSGGFAHTAVDPQESWAWAVDSLDALLRARAAASGTGTDTDADADADAGDA
jgi:AcrR family transcriptional regulator